MDADMHRWCEVELEYYTWTMQYIWFNTVEDRTKFIRRWLYPSWLLWKYDHAYGIQINDYANEGSDLLNQMNSLGAKFDVETTHSFLATAQGMMQDFSNGEFPPKEAAWVGATYDQAMIGKMCGLDVFKTPPLRELGVDTSKITKEEAIVSRDRRLLGVYGVVLPESARKNRD